ncbi:hypothetical protein [Ruminococcus sp.]|uniref:hypothetical protein n=1 Tax=Ruminococcus sp. TaxID=41978 RepID=UPI0025F25935|nr:hypothetical protein [Ruminococcus sp.]
MKKTLAFILAISCIASTFSACTDEAKTNDNQVTDVVTLPTIAPTLNTTALTSSVVSSTTTTTNIKRTSTQTNYKTTSAITTTSITTTTVSEDLTSVQENSIAWLNYLAMISQEINSSQNSKMYLEEAYAALINNTNPANVNELTESHLVSLLDIIEKYRMIAIKRDRLKYIYEQNKAKALRAAIPNPIGLLSATESIDPVKLIASGIYMAVDSFSSYSSYKNEVNQEYLKDGWELDDEAAENLHDSRKRAFTYMIDIVRQDDLPGDLALNESAIEKFVDCKNNTNVNQQIQFLEANENTYHAFGSYWLLLSECYYNNQQYQKCLDCITEYENLHSDIFRKDYSLAKTLPLAVAAASQVQTEDKYVKTAEKYLEMITDNTESDEWDLRYFAAEMYVDLYTKTQKKEYLQSAYDISLNNVNYLTAKQKEINSTYIASVKKVSIPKTASKKEKKKIEAYNDALEDKRETELPETYEPLAINCELLFAVADKLKISQAEKDHIEGILSDGDNSIFLTKPIRNIFTFNPTNMFFSSEYDKDELTLPVSCVSQGAKIKVTVTSGDKSVVYEDWKIDEVERPKKDFSSFKVVYTSKKAGDCKWHKDSQVKVEIFNGEYSDSVPVVINFKVSKYKHRKVVWDTVEFEQVV